VIEIGPPPKKEDFDDYDKYVEAVVEHRTNAKLAKWRKDEEEKSTQTEYQKKISDLYLRLNRGYEKYPDFEEVAKDQSVPITMVVRDILAESEIPEDVAYYLGKNRTEAIKIARMTPFAAAKEIGRIEMELKKNPVTPTQPKIPGAPPPIKPVGSSENVVSKDPAKMTQAEWEEEAKRRGMRRF